MNKRVFFFGDINFPRGNAAANYVQYMAHALIREEWKVIVVGTNQVKKDLSQPIRGIADGIEYITFSFTGKFRQFKKKDLDYVTSLFAVNKEDYAIIYGTNLFLSNYVIKNFDKGHYASCEVELYNWKQYNHYFLNPKYIVYQIGRLTTYMKIKNMFPISTYIEKKEKRFRCRTLRLPPMIDKRISYGSIDENRNQSEVRRFIYSGRKASGLEDDVEDLVKALSLLDAKTLRKSEFHFTGLNCDFFRNKIGACFENSFLAERVYLHNWMKYEDLKKLYGTMDFLLLPRNINSITKANFPSKIPELLAFAVIPICTDVGDYTSLYLHNNENAFVFSGATPEKIADEIKKATKLCTTDLERMRKNCLRTVEDTFDYKNWGEVVSGFLIQK